MQGTKQIIRAFECFVIDRRELLSHWKFHLVTVEATSRGKAKKGKPFVHHLISTVSEAFGKDFLDKVRELSMKVESGELSPATAAMTMPSNPEFLYVPTEMTFVVEAAAIKYMKRLISADAAADAGGLGGDDSVRALYEGPFSLEGLVGKASVSPFNKDFVEVLDVAPLFDGSDESFRQRRLRRRRSKAKAAVAASKLEEGECYVRAYHAGRKTRFSGPVSGITLDGPMGFDALVELVASRAGPFSTEIRTWRPEAARHTGIAITDDNSSTTIRGRTDLEEVTVAWFSGETVVGISEATREPSSIKTLITPKI
jgi:hypothetical protein